MVPGELPAGKPSINWAAELTAALEEGLGMAEFCKKLGVGATTVRRMENRTGIRLQRKRAYPSSHALGTGINWERVLSEGKAEGLSVHQMAERLFVCNAAILNAEDRTGIYLHRKRPNPLRQGGFRISDAD